MSIKSSQTLVEEAQKRIQTLSPQEVKSLLEKKKNYFDRRKRHKRAMERGYG